MRVEVTMRRLVCGVCMLVTFACGDDDAQEMDGAMARAPDGGYPEAPCPDDTPEFRINLEAAGDAGNVVARLLDADNIPPRQFENDWTVEFRTPDGTPIEDIELTQARPWMPVHQHDGTYPPDVTSLDEPGQFQVDNLNLWMVGPWEVQLTVESESAGNDFVVFHVCID